MTTEAIDTDTLPPTQYLILEVLAARYRLGETYWTFPDRCRRPVAALESAGLVWTRSGPAPGSFEARFTDVGRAASISASYRPPRTHDEAMARLRALAEWMTDSGCGLGGQQIIALVEDPRSIDVLRDATRRTGHRIGCNCNRCTDGGEG